MSVRLLVLALVIGVSAVGWKITSDRQPEAPAGPPTVPAVPGPVWAEGVGHVEPRSEIRRLAFKSSGVITRCGPAPGERVPKGHVLAELDDRGATLAVEEARRRLELARCRLTDLKAGEHPLLVAVCRRAVDRLRERARQLRADSERVTKGGAAVSESERTNTTSQAAQADIALREKEAELEYLETKTRPEQVAVAEAEVRLAEAQLADADRRLADTRLTAPFDGTVLRFIKREGEGVSPLTPPETVVLFGDLSRFRVRAEIDERHARSVALGRRAEVYGRNMGGRVYPGRVVEVEAAMGDKTLYTRSGAERKDLHVLQVVVEMEPDFSAPVGLQVDVRIMRE